MTGEVDGEASIDVDNDGQWGNWAQMRAYWCPGMVVTLPGIVCETQ